jgi:Family of unknown function (DUF6064)
MRIPFTIEQFLDVMRRYNEAVWPAQWALLATGLAAAIVATRGTRRAAHAASASLALLWLWMALAHHLAFFRAINPAATLYATAFVLEAAALARWGVWRGRVAFDTHAGVAAPIGWALVLYALLAYPALGSLLGSR